MLFRQLFDPESSTYTYLLADEESREAIIIDPVLEQVDRDLALVDELGLRLIYALDTHVHADHVTSVGALRTQRGVKTVLSERAGVGCADVLVKDGDTIRFGRHAVTVHETPGHTSGCVTYVTDDETMAFTGDTVLIRGCGRTDFQEGDAHALYRSVHDKVFSLPDSTLILPAHDYKGRTASSVGEEKQHNPRLGGDRSEEEFVSIMTDLKLPYPKKIDDALPRNLQCGRESTALPTTSWAPAKISAAGVPEVDATWVAEHRDDLVLVDVREPDEFVGELGHIAGATLIPLAAIPGPLQESDRDRPVVVVCRSGGRSAAATRSLMALGFTHIASMRGGMLDWKARGLAIAP